MQFLINCKGGEKVKKQVIILTFALFFALTFSGVVSAVETTEKVSIGSGGTQSNGNSSVPSISGDGRYVAFYSEASNLVSGDNNGDRDVFVYDRDKDTTELVSVGLGGTPSNGGSSDPSISADGRFVAFWSNADNLVSGGTNMPNVYVYDRNTHTTELISVGLGGTPANSISLWPSISADGRYVAFYSQAWNLVANDNNYLADIFVRDRTLGTTTRVSVAPGGTDANGDSNNPFISGNGQFVAFTSDATNLVSGDNNGIPDVFLYDVVAHTTELVSVSTGGAQSDGLSLFRPSVSYDGQLVAFGSFATNLVADDANLCADVFVRDRSIHTTELISVALGGAQSNGPSDRPSISSDGLFVAFESDADNLVNGDTNGATDIFVYDRSTKTIKRVSVGPGGIQSAPSGASNFYPSISSTGQFVAFISEATNLASGGDTNRAWDVFVHDSGVQSFGIGNNTNNISPKAVDSDAGSGSSPSPWRPSESAYAASTTTVVVQETGSPLWLSALAVLMIIGGMVLPRRK